MEWLEHKTNPALDRLLLIKIQRVPAPLIKIKRYLNTNAGPLYCVVGIYVSISAGFFFLLMLVFVNEDARGVSPTKHFESFASFI